MKKVRASFLAGLLICTTPVFAADETGSTGEDAALLLADTPTAPVEAPRDWTLNAEAVISHAVDRQGESVPSQRLALDGQIDKNLGAQTRWVLSARADWVNAAREQEHSPVKGEEDDDFTPSIKEGYLSWQPTPLSVVDLGRVNLRSGVALGFNPTDYFKTGALSTLAPDPATRRKYRIGSLMLRGQKLWDTGAISALYSPELADSVTYHNNPFALSELRRTNNSERWMITGTHKLHPNVQPQWLVYRESDQSPQIGFNLSSLISDAALVYAEWSGGRSPAAGAPFSAEAFHSKSALGLTYTFPSDISLTVEHQQNTAGLTTEQQQALALTDPYLLGQTLIWSAARQEAATRRSWFVYLKANKLVFHKLDFTGVGQLDTDDGQQFWLELRKRYDKLDLTLQWQQQSGEPWTRFGALPDRHSTRIMFNYYF